jgi:hypothetical protein
MYGVTVGQSILGREAHHFPTCSVQNVFLGCFYSISCIQHTTRLVLTAFFFSRYAPRPVHLLGPDALPPPTLLEYAIYAIRCQCCFDPVSLV